MLTLLAQMLTSSRGSLLGVLYAKMRPWFSQGSFIYLQQVKETEDSYPKLCLLEGILSHCLYTLFGQLMLISSLQLTTFLVRMAQTLRPLSFLTQIITSSDQDVIKNARKFCIVFPK